MLAKEYNAEIINTNDYWDVLGQKIYQEECYRSGVPSWRYFRKFNAISDSQGDFIFLDCNVIIVKNLREIFEKMSNHGCDLVFGTHSIKGRNFTPEFGRFLNSIDPTLKNGYNAAFWMVRKNALVQNDFELSNIINKLNIAPSDLRQCFTKSPEQSFLNMVVVLNNKNVRSLEKIDHNIGNLCNIQRRFLKQNDVFYTKEKKQVFAITGNYLHNKKPMPNRDLVNDFLLKAKNHIKNVALRDELSRQLLNYDQNVAKKQGKQETAIEKKGTDNDSLTIDNLVINLLNQRILNELVKEVLLIAQQNNKIDDDQFPSLSKLKPFLTPNTKLPQITQALKFRISYALDIYESNSIYTFIPKNACSTMKYSVALANGFLNPEKKFNIVVGKALTLSVKNLALLLNPNYSFVILRCPYSRLVSAFFNKFIQYKDAAPRFMKTYLPNRKVDDLSFNEFINTLNALKTNKYDQHWRPQTHFLLYNEYSRYFALEDFATATKTLEQDIRLKIYDTRGKFKHHSGHIRTNETIAEPWKLTIKELKALPSLPKVETMFSPEMIKTVKSIYADDIELYCSKFGSDNLTFK